MFGRKSHAATDVAPEELIPRLAAHAESEEQREGWRRLLRGEGTASALADLAVMEQVWGEEN
jgi:IS5 family transposase